MRQGPNPKRSRGRNNGRRQNMPMRMQTFDSNGPDVRIRGSAYQVHEKYLQLARDASASGDRIMAENYLQHAEHYYRIIAAIQEQQGGDQNRRYRPEGGFGQDYRGQMGEDGEGGDEYGDDPGEAPQPHVEHSFRGPQADGRQQGDGAYADDEGGHGERDRGDRGPRDGFRQRERNFRQRRDGEGSSQEFDGRRDRQSSDAEPRGDQGDRTRYNGANGDAQPTLPLAAAPEPTAVDAAPEEPPAERPRRTRTRRERPAPVAAETEPVSEG